MCVCVGVERCVGVCFFCSQQELGRSSYFCFETLFNTRLCNLILLYVIHLNGIPECPFLMISKGKILNLAGGCCCDSFSM